MKSNVQFRRENSLLVFAYLITVLLACLAFPCLGQETADTNAELRHSLPQIPAGAQRCSRYRLSAGAGIQPGRYSSARRIYFAEIRGGHPRGGSNFAANGGGDPGLPTKTFFTSPFSRLLLKDFEKPYFTALGKVNKPGKYDLRGDTTLTQAIAIAGGFDDTAKHSQVLLFRHMDHDRIEIKTVDVKAMLKSGNMEEDFHLRPGDMIMVPKNTLSKLRPWIPNQSMGMYMNGL